MEKKYEEFTIMEVREALMHRWKTDGELFKELRKECGTYVFDAVMAVLLGGTGVSKYEHAAYVVTILNAKDVTPWKANAGLKKNNAGDKYKNYQQRGFFAFPEVDNKRLKEEFLPDMSIGSVCWTIMNYTDDCFRNNARNASSSPKQDFVDTLGRIIDYAFEN